MGKGKHTPGPWRFEWDGDEAVILGRPTWPCERHSVRGEWQVAVTDDLLCEKPEEAEANARLIAAAPELLAFAKRVMADHRAKLPSEARDLYGGGCGCPQCEQAAAAIQKAEGK